MRTAYWDLSDGVTESMILGALFDAGLDQVQWEQKIRDTGITEWELCRTPVDIPPFTGANAGIIATGKFDRISLSSIESDHFQPIPGPVRKYIVATISELVDCGVFPDGVAPLPDAVCILGIHLGHAMLGLDPMYRSSYVVGRGVETSVTRLLQGKQIILDDRGAVLSPVAVAVMNAMATHGTPPPIRLGSTHTGFFIGKEDSSRRYLRLHTGETPIDSSEESIYQIETTIDDMNPELIPPLLIRLRHAGARDAWWTSAIIRSGRPGSTIIVLAPISLLSDIVGMLFSETTTIGVRYHVVNRLILQRSEEKVQTGLGIVRVKSAILPDGSIRRKPSMEDCIKISNESGKSLVSVCDAINQELADS